ncbi:hypothetical protein BGX38DRAFT_1169487 [Terfezia claveryi]|nr:hypothetical protein BGX38DRAFT_1169487 [Terfezia claveryi]
MRYRHLQLRNRVNTNDDDQQYRQLKLGYQFYLCYHNTASYGCRGSTRGIEIDPLELQGTSKCVHGHGDFDSQFTASGDSTCPGPIPNDAHRTRPWELFVSAICSIITEPTQRLVAYLFWKCWGETELQRKTKEWQDCKAQLELEKAQLKQQLELEKAQLKQQLELEKAQLKQEKAQLKKEKAQLQQDNLLLNQKMSDLERDKSILKLQNTYFDGRNRDLERQNIDLERRNNYLKGRKRDLKGRNKDLKKLLTQPKELEKETQRMEGKISQLKQESEKELLRMEQQMALFKAQHEREMLRISIERDRSRIQQIEREKCFVKNLQRGLESIARHYGTRE